MQITNKFKESVCIVTIEGALEWDDINEIRQHLLTYLAQQDVSCVLFDCQAIQGLDSKGGVLMTTLYQTLQEKNKSLGLFQLSEADQEGLKKFNIDQMVSIYETEEDALQNLSAPPEKKQIAKAAPPPKKAAPKPPPTKDNFHPILQPSVAYFQKLEKKIPSVAQPASANEQGGLIESEDSYQFDTYSIREALILCKQLQAYIEKLSKGQLKAFQLVYPFYKSPERLLNKLKISFMGDLKVKEKIIRIYTTKTLGSDKLTTNILTCPSLFANVDSEEVKEIKRNLWKYSGGVLKILKEILPEKVQTQLKWTPQTLVPNIKKYLTKGIPLFPPGYSYQVGTKQFREIIFYIFANPHTELYLAWKHKYLKHWLYEELFQEDVKYLKKQRKQIPRYMSIKLKMYQNLSGIFSTLEDEDQLFEKVLLLKKTELTLLKRGDAFVSTTKSLNANFTKARRSEKALLDSLSTNQLATVAEWVHKEILQIKKNPDLEEEIPTMDARNDDIASEQKAEQTYTAKTMDVQIEHAEETGGSSNKVLSALKQLKSKFSFGKKKKEAPKAEEAPPEPPPPKVPPRLKEPQQLLEKANVDWVGFGKDFKSTIYESKIPNLQKMLFDHGGMKIYLFQDFKVFTDAVIDFYAEKGYLQKKSFKVGVTVDGQNVIKNFEDVVVYLKTVENTFLALGRAPFSKNAGPSHYFQLYRSDINKPYNGTTKTIDYSKMVDGVKYELENFEKAQILRPPLFLSIIHVADSLPDNLRNQHEDLINGIHQVLNNSNVLPNRRKN